MTISKNISTGLAGLTGKLPVLLLSAFLAACGGGGGGSTPPPSDNGGDEDNGGIDDGDNGPTNQPPSFTSGNAAAADENNTATDYTAAAMDADGNTLFFTVFDGADQDLFVIDGSTGALSFESPPDFENPLDADGDNNYEVELEVSDGQGGTARQTVIVSVLDDLSFTSGATASAMENSTDTDYTATVEDDVAGSVSFSISGGIDQPFFAIDPASGALSFKEAPDFEDPADEGRDNTYEVELRALDGQGGAAHQPVVVTVGDEIQPGLQVSYPPPNAQLGGSVSTTSVAGIAIDAEGNKPLDTLSMVSVNGGNLAVFDADEPWRWRTQVTLDPAVVAEELTVDWNGEFGGSGQTSQTIQHQVLFDEPTNLVLDKAENRILVIDQGLDALFAVDRDTGERTVLSGLGVGSGTPLSPFGFLFGLALDGDNGRLLLADSSELVAVELSTGNRTVISDQLSGARDLALDSANNRVFVVDHSLAALVEVDLDTGERAVVSDAGNGAGAPFDRPHGIALDMGSNRALVTEFSGGLVAVDLTSGDRTTLADDTTGTGTNLFRSVGVALDEANNRALVTDHTMDNLVAVDLVTLERSLVSGRDTGAGPAFSEVYGLALDPDNNQALVTDTDLGAVLSVSLDGGAHALVSGNTSYIGAGTAFKKFAGVALDSINNRLLVTDSGLRALVSVDLATGDRTVVPPDDLFLRSYLGRVVVDKTRALVIHTFTSNAAVYAIDPDTGDDVLISGPGTGTGPAFSKPAGLVVDEANNRLLVVDTGSDALLAVDLDSGDRTLISSSAAAGRGIGPDIVSPRGLALDSANNRVLWGDSELDALIAVDLETGDRTELSGPAVGSGENLGFPVDLALDRANNRALIIDNTSSYSPSKLIAVDLTSGERSLLTSGTVGTGPVLEDAHYLVLDSVHNRAFVADDGLRALVAIDLETGERAISSQ